MSTQITFETVDNILDVLRSFQRGEVPTFLPDPERDISEAEAPTIKFGEAFNLIVRLPEGYSKEMPAQFLDAYHKESQRILRLIALILNGRADIKTLTADQLERYRFSVQVNEGSSEFLDNAKEVLGQALKEAMSNMSGRQTVISILGTVAIISTAWGWTTYINSKKEVRLAEIEQQERRDVIEGMQTGQTTLTDGLAEIIEIMRGAGEIGRHAADTAEAVQDDRLRAAAQTNVTEIGGLPITRDEARELRSTSRRRAEIVTIEKEMRVVDVNTADMANTSLVLEDIATGEQSKVSYSDRVLGAIVGDVAVEALRNRSTALFTLRERLLEGEIVSVEIVSARPMEDDSPADTTEVSQ
ncbi:hypothetical protein K3718_00600 [Leisingera aquaemixtae]|uniref:Uncharacterized protein n=1 Tax=Leisingera aquaemixtae TaxID=1396826 RepID=A0ABY5WJH6_9RHOB|nr:hypothetical protein [Leisingera aquaemixtae]UWQ41620.1 hypothetical protein K3718_00600 [Leisingera aquaemixtae]